jgi:hypothetical protein
MFRGKWGQFSLGSLSLLATVPQDHLLVACKSYFDGGNRADSRKYKTLTLAVFAGTDMIWSAFQDDWCRVLKTHGAPFLHTTDAVALRNAFEGWPHEHVEELITDCVSVIEKHASIRAGKSFRLLQIIRVQISCLAGFPVLKTLGIARL